MGDNSTAPDGGPVFIDWDCTITSNHMFSMFQNPRNHESVEFCNSLSQEHRKVYLKFVQDHHTHYTSWGRSDPASIESAKHLTLLHIPLIPPPPHPFTALHTPLKTFLFGPPARQQALSNFLSVLHERHSVFILTKGIASLVIAAVITFFPEWLRSLQLVVIDYPGNIYIATSSSTQYIASTTAVTGKISQIIFTFPALRLPLPPAISLIDDGFHSEVRAVCKDAVRGVNISECKEWQGLTSMGVLESGGAKITLAIALPPIPPISPLLPISQVLPYMPRAAGQGIDEVQGIGRGTEGGNDMKASTSTSHTSTPHTSTSTPSTSTPHTSSSPQSTTHPPKFSIPSKTIPSIPLTPQTSSTHIFLTGPIRNGSGLSEADMKALERGLRNVMMG